MSKTLNFQNTKKQYLNVTLTDNTTLMIGTPTKAIMDKLISLQDRLTSTDTDAEVMEDLYEVCAKAMSHNKGGINVTMEYLEELLDFEDILIFFNAYVEFIGGLTDSKN